MSDLEQAKVKLIDTIGKYNLTASNIAKFSFNKLEENVFAAMMVEFAQEQANEVVNSDEPALNMQNVTNHVKFNVWKDISIKPDLTLFDKDCAVVFIDKNGDYDMMNLHECFFDDFEVEENALPSYIHRNIVSYMIPKR